MDPVSTLSSCGFSGVFWSSLDALEAERVVLVGVSFNSSVDFSFFSGVLGVELDGGVSVGFFATFQMNTWR